MNSLKLQVALDCADPQALAAFWAEALGYEVDRNPDLIKSLLDQGVATGDDVTIVDGVLSWKTGAAMNDPDGVGPRWYFQLVEESKAVKNRMHIDIHLEGVERAAEVDRLIALGATRLYEGQQGPNTWVTMADPEGNEFCVAGVETTPQ